MSNRAVQVDFLAAGLGIPGGKVYTYEAGTLTPKLTWVDADKATPATNPIILDNNGRATVFADGAYKFTITDASDVPVGVPLDGLKYRFDNFKVRTVIADTTADTDDDVILCDASAGVVTVNLYQSALAVSTIKIKKIDSSVNDVVIVPYGAETIDGNSSLILAVQNAQVELTSNGANWYGGNYSLSVDHATNADNATTVGGYAPSTTPSADKIPVGDANGRIPWGAKPAFRGALAYNNPLVSVGNVVTWASESYDTDSIHHPSTNTERMTVPASVTKVRVRAQLLMGANTANSAYIRKNGLLTHPGAAYVVHNDSVATAGLFSLESPVLTVTAGDYFDVYCAGGSVSADASGTLSWFAMEIIE